VSAWCRYRTCCDSHVLLLCMNLASDVTYLKQLSTRGFDQALTWSWVWWLCMTGASNANYLKWPTSCDLQLCNLTLPTSCDLHQVLLDHSIMIIQRKHLVTMAWLLSSPPGMQGMMVLQSIVPPKYVKFYASAFQFVSSFQTYRTVHGSSFPPEDPSNTILCLVWLSMLRCFLLQFAPLVWLKFTSLSLGWVWLKPWGGTLNWHWLARVQCAKQLDREELED